MKVEPRQRRVAVVCVRAVMLIPVLACLSDARAEEREVKGTHSIVHMLTKTSGSVDLKPGHEFTLQSRNDRLQSNSPDFNLECALINVDDHVSFNGKHFGAARCIHASGDVAYYRFEGSHRSTSSQDGSWESAWQGQLTWLPGTGRFKNLGGEGTYQGNRSSANAGSSTWSARVNY